MKIIHGLAPKETLKLYVFLLGNQSWWQVCLATLVPILSLLSNHQNTGGTKCLNIALHLKAKLNILNNVTIKFTTNANRKIADHILRSGDAF